MKGFHSHSVSIAQERSELCSVAHGGAAAKAKMDADKEPRRRKAASGRRIRFMMCVCVCVCNFVKIDYVPSSTQTQP